MNEPRMRELLDQSGLDAVIAVSLENVAYLTGSWIVTQRLIPDRLAVVLWPSQGEPAFVLCKGEDLPIKGSCRIADMRTYLEFRTSPIDLLADAVAEKGLSKGRLGIERKSMSVAHFEELQKRLPDAQLEDGAGVLDQVRMVKTPSEVAALGAAAQVTERAIRDAFEGATSGDTEKTVADNMAAQLMGSRADIMNFLFLGTGMRSFEWHAIPGSNPLTRGDMVHTDIGGSFNGYWSDVARTVVVGRPTAKQRELHNKLYGIHVKTVESIRPGMRASDLYRLCGEAYEEAGLPFSMAHIGHGIGIGLHEHPMLNPYVEQELQPGTVLCIEPAHYEPGIAGYHIEDLVQVTEDGVKVLTDMRSSEEPFVID